METSHALTQSLWPSESRVWRKPMGWKQGAGSVCQANPAWNCCSPKASPGSSPLTDGTKDPLVQTWRGAQGEVTQS